jgi:hypothetical protein
MATVLRKTDPLVAVLATAFNTLKTQIGAGAFKHFDASERVLTFTTLSGAAAADELAAIDATNQLKAIYEFHIRDTLAHSITQAAEPTLVVATSLATAYTLANAIKVDYALHIADTDMHPNADATNTVAAADATTLGSLQTLVNEMKNTTALQAHMASAPSAPSLRAVDA